MIKRIRLIITIIAYNYELLVHYKVMETCVTKVFKLLNITRLI